MEFKVIFIGFALHCVLNTVLICKSVITNGQAEKVGVVISSEDSKMFQALNEGVGEFKRLSLQVDNSPNEGIISIE